MALPHCSSTQCRRPLGVKAAFMKKRGTLERSAVWTGIAESDVTERPQSITDHTDEAALFGSGLAAVIALSTASGYWVPFPDMVVGLSLLAVIVAYSKGADPTPPKDIAYAAVWALSFTLVVAFPFQSLLEHTDLFGVARRCSDRNCIAVYVSERLWIVWAVTLWVVFLIRKRRRVSRKKRSVYGPARRSLES